MVYCIMGCANKYELVSAVITLFNIKVQRHCFLEGKFVVILINFEQTVFLLY